MRFVFKHFSALLVVALLHAVLLMPASLSNTGKRRLKSSAGPPCTMLFPEGTYARPELVEWSLLNDPTIFALAQPEKGFSALFRPALPVSYTSTPSPPDTVAVPPPEHLPAPSLPFRPAERGRIVQLIAPSVRYLDDIQPASPPRITRRVFWSWGNGEPVVLAPALDVETVAKAAAPAQPGRDTVIEITVIGERLRLKLAQASGNTALDDMAMATVGPLLAVQESQPPGEWRLFGRRITESRLTLRVDWMAAATPK